MPQTALVTGGAGHIGSHLVERLIERGDEVHVVDNLSTGRLANLETVRGHPRLHLAVDSIMNWPMMNRVIESCDVVYHLAAVVGVKKTMEEPVETITTNVRGTEIVFDCCHRHGTALFLASASEIYGDATTPLHEEHPRALGPTTRRSGAYACTKSLSEFLALAYHHERGLPVVIGRHFSTAGRRQPEEMGMVIPTFVGQALRGEPITVHGTGAQLRTFLHVDDAVDAVLGLMSHDGAVGEIFNIGHETEVSILELARLVKERTGTDSEVRTVSHEDAYGEGFVEAERRLPDTTKLRDLLGWTPTRGLAEIVDEVADDLGSRS